MSDLHDLIQALEAAGKRELAAALRGAQPEPAAPEEPPTLLDEVRQVGIDALGFAVHEIPSLHEIPPLLAKVNLVIADLHQRIGELEDRVGYEPDGLGPVSTDEPSGPVVPASPPGSEGSPSAPAQVPGADPAAEPPLIPHVEEQVPQAEPVPPGSQSPSEGQA